MPLVRNTILDDASRSTNQKFRDANMTANSAVVRLYAQRWASYKMWSKYCNTALVRVHETKAHLRPNASDGLLASIDPIHAPATSNDVATSCCIVGSFRSLKADPMGHVTSSPVKHCSALPLSPATSAVLRAERQYLYVYVGWRVAG